MAVYTEVNDAQLKAFIAEYDIGSVVDFKGIVQGVENTNYALTTETGLYVLTIYEKRARLEDLPFFLRLMDHLAARNVPCPSPVRGSDDNPLRMLCGRPAAIVTRLTGASSEYPTASDCENLGTALANLHMAGTDFTMVRQNELSVGAWRDLFNRSRDRSIEVHQDLASELSDHLDMLDKFWPQTLPKGVIHADLFPDNVFFDSGRISGIIDFYFACTDFFAYDVAICLNAWCFEADLNFNAKKARKLLLGYQKIRMLNSRELDALPVLAMGAAVRFLLTRLYDWFYTPSDVLVTRKDPLEYHAKLKFHSGVMDIRSYGLDRAENNESK